jgi:hypothetical protein
MNDNTTTLRLDDIEPAAVELSAEEIRAVSGGQKAWHVSWTIHGLPAEWVLS